MQNNATVPECSIFDAAANGKSCTLILIPAPKSNSVISVAMAMALLGYLT